MLKLHGILLVKPLSLTRRRRTGVPPVQHLRAPQAGQAGRLSYDAGSWRGAAFAYSISIALRPILVNGEGVIGLMRSEGFGGNNVWFDG